MTTLDVSYKSRGGGCVVMSSGFIQIEFGLSQT